MADNKKINDDLTDCLDIDVWVDGLFGEEVLVLGATDSSKSVGLVCYTASRSSHEESPVYEDNEPSFGPVDNTFEAYWKFANEYGYDPYSP